MKIIEILQESAMEGILRALARAINISPKRSAELIADTMGQLGRKLTPSEITELEAYIGSPLDRKVLQQAEKAGGKTISKAASDAEWEAFKGTSAAFRDNGLRSLKILVRIGIVIAPFERYREDMVHWDKELAAGNISPADYQYKRQGCMSVAIGTLATSLAGWGILKSFTAGSGWVFGWMNSWWAPLMSGLSTTGAAALAAFLQTEEGRNGMAWTFANEVIDVSKVFGPVGVTYLDGFRVAVQNVINKAQGKPEVKQVQTEPINPADNVPPAAAPKANPSGDKIAANGYNELGQYTPLSMGVKGTADKSKWIDLGNGMLKDPANGDIAYK